MKTKSISRREWMKKGVGLATGFSLIGKSALAGIEVCSVTLPQMEGPFYPESSIDRDSDLTRLEPKSAPAEGTYIYLKGVVTNQACAPLPEAYVDIWQASSRGRYNHSEDTNPTPLDPNFQYWGRAKTDSSGRYCFKTVIPGHYPVGPNRFRPPHIHFKVAARGFVTLTTQMYFYPKTYSDLKVRKRVKELNDLERVPKQLQVLFSPAAESELGALAGEFNITLRKTT